MGLLTCVVLLKLVALWKPEELPVGVSRNHREIMAMFSGMTLIASDVVMAPRLAVVAVQLRNRQGWLPCGALGLRDDLVVL